MDLQHVFIYPFEYLRPQRGVKRLAPSVYVKAVSCFIQPKKVLGEKRNQGAHLDGEAKWTGRCGTTALNTLLW